MKYVFFQHKSLHYDIVLHCTLHCTPLMQDNAVFIATPLNLSVQTIRKANARDLHFHVDKEN